MLALREKLGPILWQFPPNFGWNEQRFREFFEMLPRNTVEAAELARLHNAKLKHGSFLQTDADRRLRYAIEVRHPTFLVPAFFDLLRHFNIAFVFADTAGKWPYAEDLTADFAYIRLHGAEQLYVSGYSDAELEWWRGRIEYWRQGDQPKDARLITAPKQKGVPHDVYGYFDNDAKVHAPFDAKRLAALI
ncbi:hypothetical protein BH18VER1_BH18VER1_08160 [soil metagenome]